MAVPAQSTVAARAASVLAVIVARPIYVRPGVRPAYASLTTIPSTATNSMCFFDRQCKPGPSSPAHCINVDGTNNYPQVCLPAYRMSLFYLSLLVADAAMYSGLLPLYVKLRVKQ